MIYSEVRTTDAIWVLETSVDYEGLDLCCIYSSYKLALAGYKLALENYKSENSYIDCIALYQRPLDDGDWVGLITYEYTRSSGLVNAEAGGVLECNVKVEDFIVLINQYLGE